MRGWIAGIALVALAACGGTKEAAPVPTKDGTSAPTPTTSGSPDTKDPAPATQTATLLSAGGLAVGAEKFMFAAGRKEVEAALIKVLGEPGDRNANEECGAGPMQFTDFAGGLTLNFQDDKLIGWNWRAPEDGDASAKGKISADGAVQIGTTKATAQAAPGFELIPDSTLGTEFTLGNGISGFIEADAVEMLYAGDQCFFR
jgi:hypothetical protein